MPPMPKRSEERRRTNSAPTDRAVATPDHRVVRPPSQKNWHPVVRDWYISLEKSPQSQYFTNSDWQAARLLAHELTRYLGDMPNAALFKALWSAMGELLTTEGARRRLRIEVDNLVANGAGGADVDESGTTSINAYRQRLAQ